MAHTAIRNTTRGTAGAGSVDSDMWGEAAVLFPIVRPVMKSLLP